MFRGLHINQLIQYNNDLITSSLQDCIEWKL
jgi:hypothetical protein